MSAMLDILNRVAETWVDRMGAVLWQSTFLAAAVGLVVLLFLRRSSPSLRYWVWQVLAIKLLLMPFWTYAIPLPNLAGMGGGASAAGAALSDKAPKTALPDDAEGLAAEKSLVRPAGPAASRRVPIDWQSWLFGGWGAVVTGQLIRLAWQRRRLHRLLRESVPADEEVAGVVRDAAGRIGLREAPRALVVERDCSPFVCGIRRPVVVLPRSIIAALSPNEMRLVLLHELAHVRRRDLVWSWIGEIARVVYFFHPIVHWVGSRLHLERELACDKLALAHSAGDAGEYAATLVRVVTRSSEPAIFKTAAVSAGFEGKSP